MNHNFLMDRIRESGIVPNEEESSKKLSLFLRKGAKKKRKKVFNADEDYIEDMDEVTRFGRMLLFPFDPIWYVPMIYLIPIEVLVRTYFCVACYAKEHTFAIYVKEIMMMYNFMFLMDSVLCLAALIVKPEGLNVDLEYFPLVVILLDIISALPYMPFVYAVFPHLKHWECLGLMHTLKVGRFSYYMRRRRSNINNFSMHLYSLASMLLICVCFMSLIYHSIFCLKYKCHFDEAEAMLFFIRMSRRTISKFTKTNFHIDILDIPFFTFEIYIIVWDLLMFVVTRVTSCHMIISMICQYKHKFEYVQKVSYFSKDTAKRFKMSQENHDIVMKHFKVEWEYRSGFKADFTHYNIGGSIPYSLLNEISIDYSWPFFQHSLLLRKVDDHILKQITGHINKTLHIAGEYIYHKNDLKEKMIYIVSGIIEVLSSENSESGVLLLTAGSCIGEVNLIVPYESCCHFRCKTTTEIYTLSRKDFYEIVRFYPNDFRQLNNMVKSRFEEARKLMGIKFGRTWATDTKHRNLLFLKNNLHRLLSKNQELFTEHSMDNIYLISDLNFNTEMNPWNTRKYMQLLVIYGRRAAKINLVFYKSTCIWILKPDSPVTHAWEYFTIAAALFTAFLLPYMCLIDVNNSWMEMFISIYLIWIIDYIILLITPVSVNSTAWNINTIFTERIQSVGFIFDTMCVIPPLFFKCFLPKFLLAISENWIYCNLIFKMHRVFKILHRWENNFYVNVLWYSIVKYLLYYFFVIYYFSCVIVLFKAENVIFSTTSVQLVTGNAYLFDAVKIILKNYFPVFAIMDLFIYCLEFLLTVSLIGAIYLYYNTHRRISAHVSKILTSANNYHIRSSTKLRLDGFIRTQLNDNNGLMILNDFVTYFNFPTYYKSIIGMNIIPELLSKINILKVLPKKCLNELSKHCVIQTYHKHCIVIGKGIVYKNVFIIVKGWSKIVIGTRVYPCKNFQMLNIFEICNEMPSSFSTIAMTEVCVLYFEYTHFKSILKGDQFLADAFFSLIRSEEYVSLLNKMSLYSNPIITTATTDEMDSTFLFTDDALSVSPFRFDDFVRPYVKLKPFTFVRIFFLRRTINPNGKFFFYWECFRCIFAFLSSILFINPVFNNSSQQSVNLYVLVPLDITAWLDIYVRMHVCHYNADGILVKHPLYTAKYYLTHSFIVDFIGVLPLNYFKKYWSDSIHNLIVANSSRLLQLHRVFGFKRHLIWHKNYLNVVYILGALICIINYCTSIAIAKDCEYHPTEGDMTIVCGTINEPSNLLVICSVIYIMTSTITTLGMASAEVVYLSKELKDLICEVSLLGFVWKIFAIGYIFSNHCLNEANVNFRKKLISGFMVLLRKEKVSIYLQKEVINYYNTYWQMVQTGNPMELFRNINVTLKRDLVYDIYGLNLVAYSTFDEQPYVIKTFYKNCLLSVKFEAYPVGGYILTINDVHPHIYFIHKGYVEVIAADGTLLDCLGPGSLFGILEDKKYERQRVSIAACTKVQVLYMPATDFFKIIEYFPTIKKNFQLKKKHRNYYIASSAPKRPLKETNVLLYNKAMVRYRLFEKYKVFHTIVCCGFGVFLEFYQISVYEMSNMFLMIQYLCDFFHIVYVTAYQYTGYMDGDRKLVYDKKLLSKRVTTLQLIFYVVTCLPLELLALIIYREETFSTYADYFIILRLNRLLRTFFLIYRQYYSRIKYTLTHGDTTSKKMLRLFYFVMLYLFSTTTILILIDRLLGQGYCSIKLETTERWIQRLVSADSSIKFEIFFKYMVFAKLMFLLKSDESYYPGNWKIQNVYVVVMIYAYTFNIMIFGLFFDILLDYLSTYMYFNNHFKFFKIHKKNLISNFMKKRLHLQLKMLYTNRHPHYFVNDPNIPNYLNETIRHSLYGYLFTNHKLFKTAHVDFVRQLLKHCKINYFPARSIIANKFDDRICMYFIHQGKVAVLKDEQDFIDMGLHTLTKGMTFGITQGIFPNNPMPYVFKSITECVILELEYKDWKYLLKFFPATKDNILATATDILKQTRSSL